MRRSSFQHAMSRFALLAMLLLAALPSAGRLAASLQEPGRVGVCTSAGLKWERIDDHGAAPAVAHTGDDCAYCPLLQVLDAPLVAPAFASRALPQSIFIVESPSSRTGDVASSGLGARGPPRRLHAIA